MPVHSVGVSSKGGRRKKAALMGSLSQFVVCLFVFPQRVTAAAGVHLNSDAVNLVANVWSRSLAGVSGGEEEKDRGGRVSEGGGGGGGGRKGRKELSSHYVS